MYETHFIGLTNRLNSLVYADFLRRLAIHVAALTPVN
jgi:hypothetical protein